MESLTSPKVVKEIIERYGFHFSKILGQNFLIDENILDKIINGAHITGDDMVLEIGPGIGTLTQKLAQNAKKVVAIEIDKTLFPILNETLSDCINVQLICDDIMKIDLNRMTSEYFGGDSFKVVANLPYYITTPIIMRFIEEDLNFSLLAVMVQKEVADRMNAVPGTKEYGALSVAVQYYTSPRIIARVPASVFMPSPKVDSVVIALDKREKPPVIVEDRKLFFQLVRASFGQRRKTLLNSLYLNNFGGYNKKILSKVLQDAGIDPRRRGETLSMDEFARLANHFCV